MSLDYWLPSWDSNSYGRSCDRFHDGFPHGTTLEELRIASATLGLRGTFLSNGDWIDLLAHDGVAILFVSNNHSIVVDPREQAPIEASGDLHIRVYDPDGIARWVNRSSLQDIWQGDCLLFTAAHSELKTQTASVFSCYHHDVGLLMGAAVAEYQIPIRNLGLEPLFLKVVNATCNCTTADLSSEIVLPGEEATLYAAINLQDKEGRFVESIVVETNDRARKTVSFFLCGAVPRERLLSTRRLYLGRLPPGATLQREIAAYDPGENKIEIRDVRITLRKPPASIDDAPKCAATIVPYATANSEQRTRLHLKDSDLLIICDISIPPTCPVGEFEFECIATTSLTDTPTITFTICGFIVPDLVARPAGIILSVPQGDANVSQDIGVFSLSNQVVNDFKISILGNHGLKVEPRRTPSGTLILTASVSDVADENTSDSIGERDGVVHLLTSDGRRLEIPYLLYTSK